MLKYWAFTLSTYQHWEREGYGHSDMELIERRTLGLFDSLDAGVEFARRYIGRTLANEQVTEPLIFSQPAGVNGRYGQVRWRDRDGHTHRYFLRIAPSNFATSPDELDTLDLFGLGA